MSIKLKRNRVLADALHCAPRQVFAHFVEFLAEHWATESFIDFFEDRFNRAAIEHREEGEVDVLGRAFFGLASGFIGAVRETYREGRRRDNE
jgi:hypothetical protein